MQHSAYGLTAAPFRLTPDARFFFAGDSHRRALAHLMFGLEQGDGIVVITGEVGTGKTMLIEHLRARLDPADTRLAHIATTHLTADALFRLALAGFGIAIADADKAVLVTHFAEFLTREHQAGRHCVLVVDEAQNLPPAALEELRMLGNLASATAPPVQIILFGQPEFRRTLASATCRQLRQRVIAAFQLTALAPADLRAYVEHRLTTAGWTGWPAFETAAFDQAHRVTDGVPRRINRLFARVLLLAGLEECAAITAAMVAQTADELVRDLLEVPA